MNYLVFDTETTGFPLKDKPADYPRQARIVQLACVLLDSEFRERACFKTLIKPDGWVISPGAQAEHGISMEECHEYGIPAEEALNVFEQLVYKADLHIAHNFKFDKQLIAIEQELLSGVVAMNPFCTMEATTNICAIPSARGGYKWPKLAEAYKHLFDEELQDAHDALVDARACARIFRKLKEFDAVTA